MGLNSLTFILFWHKLESRSGESEFSVPCGPFAGTSSDQTREVGILWVYRFYKRLTLLAEPDDGGREMGVFTEAWKERANSIFCCRRDLGNVATGKRGES